MKGIDLSHWNKITNYTALNKLDFIFHKATQGFTYLDETYKIRKAKITTLFGSYHFADGGDPIKEADWYLKNSESDDVLVLDWEIEHADPIGWSNKFLNRIKEKTGKTPYWYSNDARAVKYADKIPFPKWIARYGVNNGAQSTEPNYKNWDIWQYTSRGTIDGVTGYVDLNTAKQINLNTTMNKDFVKEIEAITGEDYGDNLNDNEQKEVASRFKVYREKTDQLIEAQKDFSLKLEDEKRAYDLLLDAAKKDSDKKNETIGIQKETIDGLENTLKNLKDGTPYIWNGDAFQGYTCDSTDDMSDVEFQTIGSKIVAFFNKLLNK